MIYPRLYRDAKPKLPKPQTQNSNTPSIELLIKLTRVFNVSVDYLIGEGKLSDLDKNLLKRVEDIEELDSETKQHLFFLIANVIQKYKTKKAFG